MIELKHSPVAPLFVPGSQPERFKKAIEKSSGDVIIDLEDSVASTKKRSARNAISEFLADQQPVARQKVNLSVRINAPNTAEYGEDITWLKKNAKGLDFVVLPMVEDPAQVSELYDALVSIGHPIPILAQIETASGILNAADIASAEGLLTLAFGAADYANEIGVSTSGELQFIYARSALINACAALGRVAPLDSPYFDLADGEGLIESTNHARELGFGGKLCIHPKQTAAVVSAFLPSEQEVSEAHRIVMAFEQAQQDGTASVMLEDGTFVDYPVYFRAKKVLSKFRLPKV